MRWFPRPGVPRSEQPHAAAADSMPFNNAAERAIWPLVLERKNWVFAGSDAGGNWAAAIASLPESAKLDGIDPAAHLHHVPGTIADHPVSRGRGDETPRTMDCCRPHQGCGKRSRQVRRIESAARSARSLLDAPATPP